MRVFVCLCFFFAFFLFYEFPVIMIITAMIMAIMSFYFLMEAP